MDAQSRVFQFWQDKYLQEPLGLMIEKYTVYEFYHTTAWMVYVRGGQPFEARVQQKEKSKLRGPHPGNTFITIKNTIYNTKSINVKSINIDCYYVSFNTPT